MNLWTAALALQVLVAALAWRYARRHPRHAPAAVLLSWLALAKVLRRTLALLNAPAYAAAAGAPLAGWARVDFHLDELLQLTWPAGLAAVAALVFLEEPHRRLAARAAGASWALSGLTLALGYPTLRRALLGRVYLALELVALAAVIACGWSWWRRREEPSLVEGTVGVFLAIEFTALWRWSPFGEGWDWQTYAYLIGYGVLAVLHGGELLCSYRSPKSL